MRYSTLVRGLAASILAGEPSMDAITARLTRTVGQRWPWIRPLARRYLSNFPPSVRPGQREVFGFLLNDRGLRRARAKYRTRLTIVEWLNEPQQMRPVTAAATWDVPPIESVSALAAWFEISVNDLLWLADLKALGSKSGNACLDDYHYRALTKSSGQIRLIEIPKPRLKTIQRQILARILEKVPPHPIAHGFVKGRSIKTFAAPHTGRRVVLRMDLQDFFPTFPAARIAARTHLWRGRPATVQNSYSPASERGPSVTDQRHRFVLSAIDEPKPFGRDHAVLAKFFNDWKLSGVLTIGSGRPVDARVAGDPDQDGNDSNDRIPGYGRNAFLALTTPPPIFGSRAVSM